MRLPALTAWVHLRQVIEIISLGRGWGLRLEEEICGGGAVVVVACGYFGDVHDLFVAWLFFLVALCVLR